MKICDISHRWKQERELDVDEWHRNIVYEKCVICGEEKDVFYQISAMTVEEIIHRLGGRPIHKMFYRNE